MLLGQQEKSEYEICILDIVSVLNINWQTANLKNIQATYAAQFQKNKGPNQKMGQRTK